MYYIIDDKVIVTHNGLRTVGGPETEIFLTPVPVRLLIFLIEHNNVALTRDEVLHAVWTSYGLTPSGSSLSQHLSKLRKCFRDFGIDEDIIKTVPQKGIMFNAQVEKINDQPPVINYSNYKKPSIPLWASLLLMLSITAIIILYYGYSALGIHSHNNQNSVDWRPIGTVNSCKIFTTSEHITEEKKRFYLKESKKFITSQKIICNSTDELLVDLGPGGPPVNQELSGDRKFFSFCQRANNEYQCNSFYYSVGVAQ